MYFVTSLEKMWSVLCQHIFLDLSPGLETWHSLDDKYFETHTKIKSTC